VGGRGLLIINQVKNRRSISGGYGVLEQRTVGLLEEEVRSPRDTRNWPVLSWKKKKTPHSSCLCKKKMGPRLGERTYLRVFEGLLLKCDDDGYITGR